MVKLFTYLFVFMCGFAFNNVFTEIDNIGRCSSWTTPNVRWEGYRAVNEKGETRCFWLEQRFPYRVRQGVEVNYD